MPSNIPVKNHALGLIIFTILCIPALGQIIAEDWNDRGLALLLVEDKYDEAIKAFDKAIQLDPNGAFAWFGKGLTFTNMGKWDEAIQAYDKAIQLNPNYIAAWFNKGIALENLGKYDEAIAAIDKAKELGFTY